MDALSLITRGFVTQAGGGIITVDGPPQGIEGPIYVEPQAVSSVQVGCLPIQSVKISLGAPTVNVTVTEPSASVEQELRVLVGD